MKGRTPGDMCAADHGNVRSMFGKTERQQDCLENQRSAACAALLLRYIEEVFSAPDLAGRESERGRRKLCPFQKGPAYSRCSLYRGQMLRHKPRLSPALTDVHDLDRSLEHAGKRQRSAKDLAAALAVRAVYPEDVFIR